MILEWRGQVGPRSSVKWSGRVAAPAIGLGLYEEPTTAACQVNLYNQDACYAICTAIGIGGWGGLLIWPCVNQCMTEACGAGILVDHEQMVKVGAKVSPCFNACMDAFQQEAIGTDEAALKAAAIQCGQKCGFGPTTQSTPGGKKIPRPGGGAPSATTPSASSATPTSSTGIGLAAVGAILAAVTVALVFFSSGPGGPIDLRKRS